MSRSNLDWMLCRTFLAALRAGSLSGAARDLRLSHVTVRRQLETLETCLGGSLFTRSQAGLKATELAARVAPAAAAMEAAAAALIRGKGYPGDFVILGEEDSPWARGLRCSRLAGTREKAERRLRFAPDEASFRETANAAAAAEIRAGCASQASNTAMNMKHLRQTAGSNA